jgi:hypothetical protein
MSDFDYLSVLISIVLGLGITNILSGFGGMIRNRGRIIPYWPLSITLTTLFLIHVQTWWTMFGLRYMHHWNFAIFLMVLAQPVFLFLASALVTPDFSEPGRIDLREGFFRERRWFYATLVLLIFISLLRPIAIDGRLTGTGDLIGHGIFLTVAVVGWATANDRVHKIVPPFILAFFITYIAVLFLNLGG